MWALVWLQLMASNDSITYYHIGTYGNKEVCERELKEAKVMVTGDNQALGCLELSRSK